MIIIALALSQAPYISNFLSWQMTFFHEISHGLAALVTGGKVIKIELHYSGSGVCYTSGGARWLIMLAGYAGAALWGLLIYLMAGKLPKRYSHITAGLLAVILIVSAVLYARDIPSWIIIVAITLFYGAAVRFRDRLPLRFILKLAALYIILDAFKAPVMLLQHRPVSDATNLAALTGVPEFCWIVLWLIIALGCLAYIWRIERRMVV